MLDEGIIFKLNESIAVRGLGEKCCGSIRRRESHRQEIGKGCVTVKEYETPLLEESKEMFFTRKIQEEFNEGQWCFGCTNCS